MDPCLAQLLATSARSLGLRVKGGERERVREWEGGRKKSKNNARLSRSASECRNSSKVIHYVCSVD